MSVLYITIGLGWDDLKRFPTILVILYSLTFFFANYGPVRQLFEAVMDKNRLTHLLVILLTKFLFYCARTQQPLCCRLSYTLSNVGPHLME